MRFNAKGDNDKGIYVLTPYSGITPHIESVIERGKAMISTKEVTMYIYKTKKYEYLVMVGLKGGVEQILDQYKSRYKDNIKDVTLRLKPRTKKHFGDIMGALNK